MAHSGEGEAEKRRTLQISRKAHDRLSKLAARSGLSRIQIVEFLVESGTLQAHLQAFREAELKPRLQGRRKKSIFAD
jgi:hypothetical protein